MGGKISLIDEAKDEYDFQAIHLLIRRCDNGYNPDILRELRELISQDPRCVNKVLRKKVDGSTAQNDAANDAEYDSDFDDSDDDRDERKITPLYLAVDKGNTFVVKELLKHHAKLDVNCDYSIPSELHLAVQNDDYDMVLSLLACGSSPHTPDNCNSYRPLKVVQSKDIADALIVMGADVNARSSVGWTNLHTTPIRDNLEVLKTLVANGANPRMRDGDPIAMTPPCNSAMISDDSKEFLYEAMRLWKKWNLLRKNQLDISKLSGSARKELQDFNGMLVPYILEGDKRAKILKKIYLKSLIFDKDYYEYRSIYPSLILSLLQHQIPIALIRYICDFFKPNIDSKVDAFYELITNNYGDDDDCDYGWDIPSDADSENGFKGS